MSNYIYFLNYNKEESKLCQFEMKYLFQVISKNKYFFSNIDIEVSRSVFIKARIEILAYDDDYQLLLEHIDEKYTVDDYKVVFINNETSIYNYKQRLQIAKEVGYAFIGEFNMINPKNYIGITKINNTYYVGYLNLNDSSWQKHLDKPVNFCSSLPIRVAKTVVNIAVGNNFDLKVVDPCCGMGTVLLEALNNKVNIDGYDISYLNVTSTRKNLDYYNYDCLLAKADIADIDKHYDVAIVDLPYGLAMVTDKEKQDIILKNAYRISDVLILIVNNKRYEQLLSLGYTIIDSSYVIKQQFKRYIYYCKKA